MDLECRHSDKLDLAVDNYILMIVLQQFYFKTAVNGEILKEEHGSRIDYQLIDREGLFTAVRE